MNNINVGNRVKYVENGREYVSHVTYDNDDGTVRVYVVPCGGKDYVVKRKMELERV